ncbi:hypothetical protein [Staphylococcus argensis]|uniref:Uncharacterized protein n=1 Tax=Staphylococcus argensis TaxID=1607738 RepID=A0A2K4FDE6_9STAP|nr:hypothetical protein [Staphylococcus argensis]MCY6991315.1 hypothetical protein [Staphylococcus argensis]POA09380.1 hypothetical protein CD039_01060 [Staphylococcus argensis]
MLIPIIVDIVAVFIIVFADLYRQHYKKLNFNTIIISMAVTGLINLLFINKYNFITITTVAMLLIWAILQFYVDRKNGHALIHTQRFIAIIFAFVMSLSTLLIYKMSEASYYMSLPYLAPAVFLIGGIVLFVSTFQYSERKKVKPIHQLSYPMTVGEIIMVLSFAVMTILTPFWYVLLIINLLFCVFIVWSKLFFSKND